MTKAPTPSPTLPATGNPLADFPRGLVYPWLGQASRTHMEGAAKLALRTWMAEHGL